MEMTLLELELWTALYLLAGVATYLGYKRIVVEYTDNEYSHGLTAAFIIALWWLVLLVDLGRFVWFVCYKAPKIQLGWRRDVHWVRKHRAHGRVTAWTGVSEEYGYWTCSCDPKHRYYPHNQDPS